MRCKPTRDRRRIQMLHDLANDGGYVALKRTAEDRRMETEKGYQKPALQQKTTDDDTYIRSPFGRTYKYGSHAGLCEYADRWNNRI